MAEIAYNRLYNHLQKIAAGEFDPITTGHIASAMLDAWSIVDSVNRFRDLVRIMPGLPNEPWKRLLMDRTETVDGLRNCVQHQEGELAILIANAGQLWGYLSWAAEVDGSHTGQWLMMSPGAVFKGDSWLYMGPNAPPGPPLPTGRVRLNAFGQELYLGLCTTAVREAATELSKALEGGEVRLVGEADTNRRGGDAVYEGAIEVDLRESDGSVRRVTLIPPPG